jgi:hypothetical protein
MVLATLLVNYHSHPYGAVLLIVPLTLAVASQQAGKLSYFMALGAFTIPSLVLTIGYGASVTGDEYYLHLRLASRLLKGFLFLLFVTLLFDWITGTHAWPKTVHTVASKFQYKHGATIPGQLATLLASRPLIRRATRRRR